MQTCKKLDLCQKVSQYCSVYEKGCYEKRDHCFFWLIIMATQLSRRMFIDNSTATELTRTLHKAITQDLLSVCLIWEMGLHGACSPPMQKPWQHIKPSNWHRELSNHLWPPDLNVMQPERNVIRNGMLCTAHSLHLMKQQEKCCIYNVPMTRYYL